MGVSLPLPAAIWQGPFSLDQPGESALAEADALVSQSRAAEDFRSLVRALILRGEVAGGMGRDDAGSAVREARAEAERLGATDLICETELAQARLESDRGHHAGALGACRSAAARARALGLAALLRQALFVSGGSLCHLGEHDLALEAFEEARMLLRANPASLSPQDRRVALGRYAGAQAQAWLMRGGLLLEASGPEAAAEPFQMARTLGEQACSALLGASPRFSHAALFGLVRVLLESGDSDVAQDWVARVTAGGPPAAPHGLALAQLRLSQAMIDLRREPGQGAPVEAWLAEVAAVRHPRVASGDLRLSLLRCLFEAHERAGRFAEALACQRQWSLTKARVRASLAEEHERWTRETLSGLRSEADDFVTLELRAPLEQAHALLQTAGEDPGVQRAAHSVRRALDIADQYLGVLRAEHLRPQDLQLLDLSVVAEDACEQMAPPDAAPVRLARHIQPGVWVLGDRLLLMRAIGNLLSNAFKHAPAGSEVAVRLTLDEGEALLSVADRGPGLPVDMRVRLFQRFATGAVRKGNGLGLAMVARAARVHQARIVVDSEPGQGTEVTLAIRTAGDAAR